MAARASRAYDDTFASQGIDARQSGGPGLAFFGETAILVATDTGIIACGWSTAAPVQLGEGAAVAELVPCGLHASGAQLVSLTISAEEERFELPVD